MSQPTDQQQQAGNEKPLHCSFCDKASEAVERLVAGPGGVSICNECVFQCLAIVCDSQVQSGRSEGANFERGTWTFRMEQPFKVSAGRFLLIPASAFNNCFAA